MQDNRGASPPTTTGRENGRRKRTLTRRQVGGFRSKEKMTTIASSSFSAPWGPRAKEKSRLLRPPHSRLQGGPGESPKRGGNFVLLVLGPNGGSGEFKKITTMSSFSFLSMSMLMNFILALILLFVLAFSTIFCKIWFWRPIFFCF